MKFRTLAGYLSKRHRTRLDIMCALGLGYVIGAQALGTWWGLAVFLASFMGVIDTFTTLLRRWGG